MDQNITATLENILQRRPAVSELVRPFAALFSEKMACIEPIRPHIPHWEIQPFHDRMMSGVPFLHSVSLDMLTTPFDMAADIMLPAIRRSFPRLEPEIEALLSHHHTGKLPLVSSVKRLLDGGFSELEASARSIDFSPDTLLFILHILTSTVLGSLGPEFHSAIDTVSWSKGYCPVCGALPSIAFLAGPSENPGEFLTDTGGRKFLHCWLCGHNWRFNRHACPVCENTDKNLQIYLTVPGEPGERVDICHKCGMYLPCLDVREQAIGPHLDTAATGMVHLDLIAQQKGFQPISRLPWNHI